MFCRQGVRRKSERWFARCIAGWPKSDGTKGSASFSVNLYSDEMLLNWRFTVDAKTAGARSPKGPIFRSGLIVFWTEPPPLVFGRNGAYRVPAAPPVLKRKNRF